MTRYSGILSLKFIAGYIFSNLFIKKRLVTVFDRETYFTKSLSHSNFKVFQLNRYNEPEYSDFVINTTIKRSIFFTRTKVKQKLKNQHYTAFVALEKTHFRPVGVSWTLESGDNIYWHDSFPIPAHSALLHYSYVLPEYRQQGVYSEMLRASYEYLFETQGLEKVYGIIEHLNKKQVEAQIYSDRKYGITIESVNYLIKMFGVNILAFYKNRNRIQKYRLLFR